MVGRGEKGTARNFSKSQSLYRVGGGHSSKASGKMKKYGRNMTKYEGKMKKYEGNKKEYIGRRTWKNAGPSSRREGGNLMRTRTQFLRWSPVSKGKLNLPPINGK